MKNLIVFTGAGMSAESGLKTFRDMGGLWEEYDVIDVASPQGWEKDMDLVLRFYNERRRQLVKAQPNKGHKILAELENSFNVQVITQNVDDLHERAGSKNVLHLHGELIKAQSTAFPELVYEIIGTELNRGDLCENGYQLRPHVVWFGESVPNFEKAAGLCRTSDIFLVIGTSLNVYPAASLIDYVPADCPIFLIDPNTIFTPLYREVRFIKEKASTGLMQLKEQLGEIK